MESEELKSEASLCDRLEKVRTRLKSYLKKRISILLLIFLRILILKIRYIIESLLLFFSLIIVIAIGLIEERQIKSRKKE